MIERIDKIIGNQTGLSRKEVKEFIKKKKVKVNGNLVTKSDKKISKETDTITIDNKELKVQDYVYLVLNKPKGYISATKDDNTPTVLDLVPEKYRHRNLFPAGRLDKDTTGLMIITDDGEFSHNILSPKKHVEKTYRVVINIPITEEMITTFEEGIKLKDGECKPSKLEPKDKYTGIVTLTEGRYHQIKRMFGVFHAQVIELERIKMGNLPLPKDLEQGQCRELRKEELEKIKNCKEEK